MQIRLTVVDPLGQPSEARGHTTACDVLVTAPSGTALAAVAPGLAAAVGGGAGAVPPERGRESGTGPVVLYAGAERLDAQRCTLGEPPLTDGAVLSLGAPAEPGPEVDESAPRLHVVAGPDAGGVHFLHGGRIDVGRSADADVPLDDPDVSRFHCTVIVVDDGRVWVADNGSTNGTELDGTRVDDRPVRFPAGSLLRIGESALRLAPPGAARVLDTTPDGEGHVRVVPRGGSCEGEDVPDARGSSVGVTAEPKEPKVSPRLPAQAGTAPASDGGTRAATGSVAAGAGVPGQGGAGGSAATTGAVPHARAEGDDGHAAGGGSGARTASGAPAPAPGAATGACGHATGHGAVVPGRSAPRSGSGGSTPEAGGKGRTGTDGGTGSAAPGGTGGGYGTEGGVPGPGGTRKGTPLRGTDAPREPRRRGGFTAWARRLTGGRGDRTADDRDPYDVDDVDDAAEDLAPRPPVSAGAPETWPDPAALLLTALGPGPRLWERTPGHPELLTVRLGTADRTAPDGTGVLPAVPVTTGLREVGALGLAGPRARLTGLARAVVAQLAALHSPDTLELVLISADRSRPVDERTAEWAWFGWLPHVRPGHGQDCRLLLAYDHEQATARTDELLRRLEDHLADTGPADGTHQEGAPGARGAVTPASAGPYTVVLVDGDPGGADVREAVARLALDGPVAGIHVICLAETDAASPASPVTETYEAACAASPVFRACGAVALLSGDVATALRLMRVPPARPTARDTSAAAAPRHTGPDGHARAADADGQAPARTAAHGPAGSTNPTRPGGDHRDPRDRRAPHERHERHEDREDRELRAPRADRDRPDPGSGSTAVPRPRSVPRTDTGRTSPTHVGLTARPPADAPGHARTGRPDARGSAGAPGARGSAGAPGAPGSAGAPGTSGPVTPGTVAAVDAVSAEWAERFARALAPLRAGGAVGERHARVSAPLPQSARLLDELGLARATPASLLARWADAADDASAVGGRARAVLGAGPRGPVCADLVADGPHLLIEGPPGSGRTELLRSVAASLAAAERPGRLGITLVDGRDGTGRLPGDGLGACTDLPHVGTHLTATDPVRMREFAQSLSAELKRRAELLGRLDFVEWHTNREVSDRLVGQRAATGRGPGRAAGPGTSTGTGTGTSPNPGPGTGTSTATPRGASTGTAPPAGPVLPAGAAEPDAPSTATIRLRPAAGRERPEPGPPLARLVLIVDDLDTLLSPPLGAPGRPAAGSVVRALEAAAREGARLGVHLVAATAGGARTAETVLARAATLRVTLDAPAPGPDEPAAGRGRLTVTDGTAPVTSPTTAPTTAPGADPVTDPTGRTIPFQAGRVTGRIPRTATLRPTVVPLEWARMGDPPARRPVRELGNGPTDLALLASALDRAARSVAAKEVPSLL
ncbi:hypothetical protein GCM10010145_23600 [Streptomyces ruber]|uniref:Cell division protein FtsK n=2 Tax=Streptomyces TaxID=1883 RepID=A0A918EPW3_9ACTN|nr:FHA domain-containing protein [Streptomyces ruber]GGQ53577.1 hypothetical protein GCM10010145_23600 [Streptomyces ruber]